MSLVTTKQYALWVVKQTARGVLPANAANGKRCRQVTGNLRSNRSDGRERYGTSDRFGDSQHFVDSLTGDGEPGIQAQPGILAYMMYLFAGQETVTGAADPFTHEATPAAAGPFWSRWWKSVGVTDVVREVMNDCKIGRLVIEGSTGQKVVRVTPSILSLDPGEKFAADLAKDFDTDNSFVYTEGEAAFEINNVAIRAQSQFTITLDEALEFVFTDSVVPLDLAAGEPAATVALTLALNEEALSIYNTEVYGSANPAAGTKPLKSIPVTGAYDFLLTKSATRTFKFELPGVHWTPDVAVEPNPAGGLTEISLAGDAKKVGSNPIWRSTVKTLDPAYT